MKLTFENRYHNTEASIVVSDAGLSMANYNKGLRLSNSQSRRLQATICGHPDNKCRCQWGTDDTGKWEIRLHQDSYGAGRVWPVYEIIPAA